MRVSLENYKDWFSWQNFIYLCWLEPSQICSIVDSQAAKIAENPVIPTDAMFDYPRVAKGIHFLGQEDWFDPVASTTSIRHGELHTPWTFTTNPQVKGIIQQHGMYGVSLGGWLCLEAGHGCIRWVSGYPPILDGYVTAGEHDEHVSVALEMM